MMNSVNYTIVGNCPKCGAPVYSQQIWQGITPPPSQPSCSCSQGLSNNVVYHDMQYGFETIKYELAKMKDSIERLRSEIKKMTNYG